MIRFLEQGEIDRKKWDKCIQSSKAGLIYGFSWYLDLVAPGWAGLVEDDYYAIMPLPVRKRLGISYIYQPVFAQQLGVYSRKYVDAAKVGEFISAIPSSIKYIDLHLNFTNDVQNLNYKISQKINCELKLNRDYHEIEKKYHSNTRRNIQKSLPDSEIVTDTKIPELVRLKRINTKFKRKKSYYEWMNCYIDKILQRGKGFIIGAQIKEQVDTAAFFIICGKRIYYMIPVSGEKGKEARAMFAILDYVIGKYAGTGLILDFEGSNIPGIRRFFAGFGAKLVHYHHLQINRLPLWIRIFKK